MPEHFEGNHHQTKLGIYLNNSTGRSIKKGKQFNQKDKLMRALFIQKAIVDIKGSATKQ